MDAGTTAARAGFQRQTRARAPGRRGDGAPDASDGGPDVGILPTPAARGDVGRLAAAEQVR